MSFYLNDKVAIMKITKNDILESNAKQEDTLGIINHAINIKGVNIAILFIKQDDESFFVSLRGKNGVDVTSIATAFGGGGHDSVAAFQYGTKLSELKTSLLSLCQKSLPADSSSDGSLNLFGE